MSVNTLGDNSFVAPIAIGSALMVMIFAGGHISGAHFNPAVTLGVFLRGKIGMSDVPGYMIAQFLAGAVAAGLGTFLLADKAPLAANALAAPAVPALIAEVLGTFALVYVILNVATSKGTSGNSFYGLAIGFTVTAMAYALGPVSGGAFNPAVALGLSIASMFAWSSIWIYIVGCFAGGALAALIFNFVKADDDV